MGDYAESSQDGARHAQEQDNEPQGAQYVDDSQIFDQQQQNDRNYAERAQRQGEHGGNSNGNGQNEYGGQEGQYSEQQQQYYGYDDNHNDGASGSRDRQNGNRDRDEDMW